MSKRRRLKPAPAPRYRRRKRSLPVHQSNSTPSSLGSARPGERGLSVDNATSFAFMMFERLFVEATYHGRLDSEGRHLVGQEHFEGRSPSERILNFLEKIVPGFVYPITPEFRAPGEEPAMLHFDKEAGRRFVRFEPRERIRLLAEDYCPPSDPRHALQWSCVKEEGDDD